MVSIGVYAILVTQTLNALGTMIVLPTLPFYAMSLGANAFTISLMASAYNLVQVFCSPALGTISDKVGRKKVMVVGLLTQALCNTFMSYSWSVPRLLVARMSVGVALSTGPVEMAYIMDFVDSEQELAHVLAIQRFMTSGGALLGPIVAGIFEEHGFPVLCRGLVIINIINLIIGISLWKDAVPKEVVLKEVAPKQDEVTREDSIDPFSPMGQLFGMRGTRMLLLVSFLYTLGYGIGDGPEVVFFKEHFDFGKRETCSFFTMINLACLVVSPMIPYVMDRLGAQTVCIIGCFGACFSTYSLVFMSGTTWVPYIYGIFMVGIFGSMVGLGFMQLVQRKCPRPLMGTMLGLQSSMNGVAGTIAPPLGGAMYDLQNFTPFILTSTLLALTGVMYGALPPDTPLADEEPIRTKVLTERKRPQLRRSATFGMPIYPDKSFAVQVAANKMRLDMDPELTGLYEQYRALIDSQRGLRAVATVPGDMASEQVAAATQRERTVEDLAFNRAGTMRF